ncbi:MAG: hypothetical protein LUE97_09325, partial [Oscillospiraceae bacterium]|nr:hypothetical protein [Oscillospiraceae bacterium]
MRKKGTWKTKRKGRLRQGLGFVLSAAMVMGLSGGSILTAYAAGGDDTVTVLSEDYELDQDADGYYLIYDEDDILAYAKMLENGYADSSARLAEDITVSADTGFAGFGTKNTPYAGIFDGNGCTVTLSLSTDGAAGLFAYVSGATIEDVTTAGTVESSVNTYGCAGLVSYVMTNGVTIRNCVNQADVSGAGYVAGLVGRCSGSSVSVTVADSSNEGSITATGSYAGGIAGIIYNGSISGCINYGAVSGTGCNGGIAGFFYGYGTLEISDCGNEGTVTGSGSYTGGIAGMARCSSSASLTLDGLYNAGTVSGTINVGGITGRTYVSLSNAYNAGTVSGTAYDTGGLVGNNYVKSTVLSNAYNAGEVTYTSSSGVTYAGGLLVGSIGSSSYLMYVDNAYYLSTLDGSAVASGSSSFYSYSTQAALTDDELAAMAKTSSELQNLADTLGDSFEDNFVDTYHGGYPILSWEDNGDDPDTVRYAVAFTLTKISTSGRSKATAGSDYTAILTADEYYALPESITVTVGGSELVSGEGYAYDAPSGTLTIYASYITGDIEITAAGIAPYSVSTSLTCLSSDGASKAVVGSDYTATLTADTYYALPESITVTVGGSELVSGEGYAYDAPSGTLTIYASYITGDIEITAAGIAPYSVSTSLTCLSSDGASKAVVGSDYTATLTADTYYALPESITVTVGGSELVSGEGYAYDAESGSLTVYASCIIGDIEITAAGVPTFTVLEQDEDGYYLITSENDILTFAIMVEAGYASDNARLTADITVSADSGFAGIGTYSAPYAGTFDGNGCTVNLSMSTSSAAGLFAYVSGATIEDVTTAGTVASSVNAYGCAGLVSYVMTNGVTIRDCVNQADVSGAGYVAGLVGRSSGTSVSVTVADSSNEGSITATSAYAGGIAAYIYNGSISGCVNYGAVSGTTYKGGIAGCAYSYSTLEISDCGNEGAVTGSNNYTGGIVGYAYGSSSKIMTLDGLYNAGTVSGTTYVGGITGRSYASLSNAYNAGTVSGTAVSTGGLIGNNYLKSTVLSNAYNAGEVTYTSSGVTYAGGLLVGSITGSGYLMYVDNAYYLSILDGSVIASGSSYLYSKSTMAKLTDDELTAMAKTSDELSALTETLGDSFVANMDSGYHLGYPVLAWETSASETVTYDVDTTGLTNISLSGDSATTATEGVDYSATLVADDGYTLPDTVTVTVGGTELTADEDYSYDAETGVLTVYAEAVTGTIAVTASGVEETGDDAEELQITSQPEDYTGTVGSTAVFEVEATGSGLTYQWQYLNAGASTWRDSGMSGADTASISVPVTEARDGQQYRCVVTDGDGNTVTSDAATLTVTDDAGFSITLQPSDYTGLAGTTATFTV